MCNRYQSIGSGKATKWQRDLGRDDGILGWMYFWTATIIGNRQMIM
ncbi:MAG: hypothetical protein M9933_14835 [Chitinophagaceae bacterium]|nr:hypothetical protein [Chitinophagaceae bacterium]